MTVWKRYRRSWMRPRRCSKRKRSKCEMGLLLEGLLMRTGQLVVLWAGWQGLWLSGGGCSWRGMLVKGPQGSQHFLMVHGRAQASRGSWERSSSNAFVGRAIVLACSYHHFCAPSVSCHRSVGRASPWASREVQACRVEGGLSCKLGKMAKCSIWTNTFFVCYTAICSRGWWSSSSWISRFVLEAQQ